MLKRAAALLICAWMFLFCALVFGADETATTVFLLRHAEKQSDTENPELSPAGNLRAESLVHVLGSSGVAAIYTSQYLRTIKTAEPLAVFLKLTPVQVDAKQTPELVKGILADHKGQAVLVVGHSNTVPEIISALGASVPPIEDGEYDNLYVVNLPAEGKAAVARIKFGEAAK